MGVVAYVDAGGRWIKYFRHGCCCLVGDLVLLILKERVECSRLVAKVRQW